MKKSVNYTATQRLDNPDYLRISAFAYAYAREAIGAVFGHVKTGYKANQDAPGGVLFHRQLTNVGPQPKSLNDKDTDFLIDKKSEEAVLIQKDFNRLFTLEKQLPIDAVGTLFYEGEWVFRVPGNTTFYKSQRQLETLITDADQDNRIFSSGHSDAQTYVNKLAHDNAEFKDSSGEKLLGSQPIVSLKNVIRATPKDVPENEKRFIKEIASYTPSTFELSPYKTKVTTFSPHQFAHGDYIKIEGVFPASPDVTYFQGTHRIEKISNTEFLLYGTASENVSQGVASQIYAFKKKRFLVVACPSRVYDGISTAPDDDVSGLRGVVTDFEYRKFSSTTKDPNDQTTDVFTEKPKLTGTRVREVVYYKAEDLPAPDGAHIHPTFTEEYQINPETQGTPIAICVGYTDEFHTVLVKNGARFTTIKDEDKGKQFGNVVHWNHQYKFPANLASLGIQDTDYEVSFEAYTRDGGSVVDAFGTQIIDEIAAINKTSNGFQIQFRLNIDADQGIVTYEDDEEAVGNPLWGGKVHQDILLRIKISEAYAQPIILPTFGFDGLFGFHREFRYENSFYGMEKNVVWKGESLLAADLVFGDTQSGVLSEFAEEHVGFDFPLWQKESVASRYISFGNETAGYRPSGLDYDIITTATSQPSGTPLKGSTILDGATAAEGAAADQGNFTIERKSRNGFEIKTDLLPEPHKSSNLATESNGAATIKIEVQERGVVIFHHFMPFGEQRVPILSYLDPENADAGDLSWERRGPNSILVKNATGNSKICNFAVRVNSLHIPSDTYAAGAGDGTFGGNRRQGNGILASLSNMRTQLAKIADPVVPVYSIDPDVNPEFLPSIGPKHSMRQLAIRLQRIKTILLNNGLIEIDGNSSAGDSTLILQTELLHKHKRGQVGNAPLADPQASQGKAGEVIFEAQTILAATKTTKTVQFPQHIKNRCDRGELTLDPSEYLVILTVYGQAGNELQFEENENPFVIESKKEKSFKIKSSSSFTTDTTIVYEVCLPMSGETLIQTPRYGPVVATPDFEYVGGNDSEYFISNSFKGLENNAQEMSQRFDHMRNVLRNGQNIPLQWCTIDWKHLDLEDYQVDETASGIKIYAPFTMEVKKWGSGNKGFQYAPKLMYERYTQGQPTKANDVYSIENDIDMEALEFGAWTGNTAKQYIRSHTFRIRFYLGNADGATDSEQNYLHYDPGATVKRLRPAFMAEAESPPIFDTSGFAQGAGEGVGIEPDQTSDDFVANAFLSENRPRGFIRGLLITETQPQKPFFWGSGQQITTWPLQNGYTNQKAGCYWGEDRFGKETMQDGTSQYFVDYRIWNLRRLTYDKTSTVSQFSDTAGTLWQTKTPLNIVAIGRPDGNKRFQDGSVEKPAGNLTYD